MLSSLGKRAVLLTRIARASILFRRWTLSDRIIADGYIRIVNRGTIRVDRLVDFRGGSIPSEFLVHPDAELAFGESCHINYGTSIECARRITFGKRVMVSKMVRIRDTDGTTIAPVTIGDDVWIAHGAIIEPGVTIGDGAVVSAGRWRSETPPATCRSRCGPSTSSSALRDSARRKPRASDPRRDLIRVLAGARSRGRSP